jgi:hypothetical protein
VNSSEFVDVGVVGRSPVIEALFRRDSTSFKLQAFRYRFSEIDWLFSFASFILERWRPVFPICFIVPLQMIGLVLLLHFGGAEGFACSFSPLVLSLDLATMLAFCGL